MNKIPLQNIYNNFSDIYISKRNGRDWSYEHIKGFQPYFYEPNPEGDFTGYDGTKLTKIYCKAPHEVNQQRTTKSFAADILYTKRWLLDNVSGIEKSETRWIAYDIESPIEDVRYLDPMHTKQAPYPITFICAYDNYNDEYKEWDYREWDSEYAMLKDFCNWVRGNKPDLLLPWNGLDFDHPYLYYRYPDLCKEMSPIGMEQYKGKDNPTFPALIAVVDPMALLHKYTGGKLASYALDKVAVSELGEDTWGETDFINDDDHIKDKCKNDVRRMVEIIDKYNLVDFFDNLRRFSICLWEDLPSEKRGWEWQSNNSKPWDLLFLRTADEMGLVLKSKPKYSDSKLKKFEEDVTYKRDGAYRETFQTGIFKDAIKEDLSGAYPNARIQFCLDENNLIDPDNLPDFFPNAPEIEEAVDRGYEYWSKTKWGIWLVENNILPIPVRFRESVEELSKRKEYKDDFPENLSSLRWIVFVKQNPDNVSSRAFKKPMDWKNECKTKYFECPEEDPKKKILKEELDGSKRFGNSGFGISGNKYNRLFNLQIFNANTALIRDLMSYVIKKIDEKGYKTVLTDTDSCVILTPENINKLLNKLVLQWGMEKYGKTIDIEFTHEGIFKQLYVGAKCRYIGYLESETGINEEIKGLQIKRKDSSKFTKIFQKAFLRILLKSKKIDNVEDIKSVVKRYIKVFKQCDIEKIGTPVAVKKPREEYKKKEVFFRAIDATKEVDTKFDKKIGDRFWWLYVDNDKYSDDVLAFDKNNKDIIDHIDYPRMLEKHIFNVLVPIFQALSWGKELLDLAEEYKVILKSEYRNQLLEEYDNFDELKKYYGAREAKKRIKETVNV